MDDIEKATACILRLEDRYYRTLLGAKLGISDINVLRKAYNLKHVDYAITKTGTGYYKLVSTVS